jgi:hypothetical protein
MHSSRSHHNAHCTMRARVCGANAFQLCSSAPHTALIQMCHICAAPHCADSSKLLSPLFPSQSPSEAAAAQVAGRQACHQRWQNLHAGWCQSIQRKGLAAKPTSCTRELPCTGADPKVPQCIACWWALDWKNVPAGASACWRPCIEVEMPHSTTCEGSMP